MKKLFIGTIVIIVLGIFCYGIYYYLKVSSFNVVNDTVVISDQESYQIDIYSNDEKYTNNMLYQYESSDTSVATVTEDGRILSVSKGDATITVKRGFKTEKIKVTVYEKEIDESTTSNSNSNANKEKVVKVTGIKLATDNAMIKVGDSLTINYTIVPENATNKNVTYTSDNNDVVSINKGIIIGKKNGMANITVKTVDGEYSAIFKVTVSSSTVNVTGISAVINNNKITVGQTAKITTKITPNNASNKSVTYKSNNTAVATVDANGNVTGKSAGTASITITTNDGNKKANVSVTVSNPVHATSLTVTGASTVTVGKTISLKTDIRPANAIEKTATWTSSNPDVASVSNNGVVTGKKVGKTTISAKLPNGVQNGIVITVKEAVPTFKITFTPNYTGSNISSWSYVVTRNSVNSSDYVGFTCGNISGTPSTGAVPGNADKTTTCTFKYKDSTGSTLSTSGQATWK
jgi:uncharacterized protein YjdB